MATNVPKKNQSLFRRPLRRLLGRHASSGQGTSATPSIEVAVDSASTATTLAPTDPQPRQKQKLGLVNLTPDLSNDHIDPRFPDIIAIHGIGGDLYKTWTHESGALWLRDFLPKNITGARVFSFGYDAEVALTKSRASLDNFAQSFLNNLRVVRNGEKLQSRPLIFICHSMGGIVLKRALTIARLEAEDEFPFLQSSIKGIFFLGTPHRGSDAIKWPQLLANILHVSLYMGSGLIGCPRRDLLQDLRQNSDTLKSISTDFRNQAKNIKIFSCIEQHATPPLSTLIVDQHTGVLDFPDEVIITMDGCDHRTMCRFSDEDDPTYRVIQSRIKELIGIHPKKKTKEEKDCLQYLCFERMDDRKHDVELAAENTCAWLLEHHTFTEWIAQERGLLWISGNPGAGKSTLLKYALQNIAKNEAENQNKAIFLSFFFHGRGAELQKTPLGFFRSILHQLLDRVPSASSDLIQDFKKNCETKGKPGEKWNWGKAELRDFLKSSLRKTLENHSVRIFVDAIDEGGDKVAREMVNDFQSLIAQSSAGSSSCFTICFTCRHYPIIEYKQGAKIWVERENSADIKTYVQGRLTDNDPEISQIGDIIIQRASGIFQWARLVVDLVEELHLEGNDVEKIEGEIQRIPKDLKELYRGLLEGISQEERPRVLRFIYWMLFAIRPLSLNELRVATAIDLKSPCKSLQEYQEAKIVMESNHRVERNHKMERRVKSICRGLVETRVHNDTHTVQFIHQSVNDFFLDDGLKILLGSSWISIDSAIGHGNYLLSRACIYYIDMETSQQDTDLNTFLKYATTSWIPHTERSHAKGIPQGDLLDYFHWPSDDLIQRWIKTYRRINNYAYDCPAEKSTLLHLLSRYGLINSLLAVLESLEHSNISVEVDSKDNNGQTPLSWAAVGGHEAVVRLLVERDNVEADSKDNDGQTLLSRAAVGGHEAVVRLLVERDDVEADSKDNYGQTPLSRAAEGGHEAIVRLLVEQDNVKADSKNNYGRTPLSRAAEGGHEAIVRLLIEQDNVEADSKDDNGQTPLWLAARNRHEAIVKLLIEQDNVKADSKDNDSRTPLWLAARNGHKAIVRLLVERDNVKADSKDNNGWTPLSQAAKGRHEAIVRLLVKQDNVKADSKDDDGRTPLWLAAGNGHEAIVRLLVERDNVEADSKDDNGRTLLWLAARNGHEAIVRLLVEQDNVEADSKDNDGQTPLWLATGNRHEAIVRLLVEQGNVKADSKDNDGRTPLWLAARNRHEAIVRLLVEQDNVEADSKDNYGRTPLSRAAEGGHEAIVRLLVEQDNVKADSKDNDGQTPLWLAAGNGHEAIVRLLIERDNVEADSKDNDGRTLLWLAARNGHEAIVRLLVERDDVEADSKDNDGQTPLSRAAKGGHEAIVRLLVEQDDVEADSKDDDGRTPLWLAAGNGHEAIVRLLVEQDDVEADSKDDDGRTPLWLAAGNGHEAIVRLLVERDNVEADSKDNDGRTPLWLAAGNGHEAIVRLLVEQGNVEADSKDNDGRTPLWLAARNGHEAIVRLLVEQGNVEADSKDNDGRTPLWLAARNGHEAVVKLLQAHNT